MYGLALSQLSLFFVIIVPGLVGAQNEIGDSCTVNSSGSRGTCKLFSECPSARQDLARRKFPQTCGFEGTQTIVCCPEAKKREPGELSKKKCGEYARYVYQVQEQPILKNGPREFKNRSECGHTVVELIVGGKKAGRREFPHMASVGFEPTPGDIKWLCGGTIVSERYILTAAHCLSNNEVGDAKWVRIGVTNLNVTRRRGLHQDIKVAELIKYPEYKSSSHYHDIGLLKLEKEAHLNPYARPACLYLKRDVITEKAIATGWGHTQFYGDQSVDLRRVTLDLFTNDFCNSKFRDYSSGKLENGIVDELQMCAGSADPNKDKDTCQGDSGGPLQIYHIGDKIKCMYDIVGVTSFGVGCGGSPGVYTRVFHYIEWIENEVWKEETA